MNTSDNQEEINHIPSEESVARILSEEWFVKDKLLSFAFALYVVHERVIFQFNGI